MDANTRRLERIFDQTASYKVPIFQRPYVWNKEDNWEPLWDDIHSLLDKHLRGAPVHPHFLGAVVLEQLQSASGSNESRQVIDGQQRFTSLQLFLIAARDHAVAIDLAKYIDRFSDLVTNKRSKVDNDDDVFKVWPTNGDRDAFRLVHKAGSPQAARKAAKAKATVGEDHKILGAYRYFHEQLGNWFSGSMDEPDDNQVLAVKSSEERLESLWTVVKECLQVVVIDLHKEDETQVIFETLNARGTDLLPADLVKNFLFRRALANNEKVERLNTDFWQHFETEFWRKEIKQGRVNRPRIDLFITHYLTMMTLDEVRTTHLFNAFKAFVLHGAPVAGSTLPYPNNATQHIEQLARYAQVFRRFYAPAEHKRFAQFLQRLEAVDTATVLPFLLYAYEALMPDAQLEFDRVLDVLEAFLVRRLIVNLTPKNYNRLFVDLIKAIEKEGAVTGASVEAQLRKGSSDSNRFPNDDELRTALFELPLYGRIAQYKVRVVLEALDAAAHSAKTEALPLPPGLTIEHVMPQSWKTHWPLPRRPRPIPLPSKKPLNVATSSSIAWVI